MEMSPSYKFVLLLAFLHAFVSASALPHCSNGWFINYKDCQPQYVARRTGGGAMGLIPFPRVGRAQADRTWLVDLEQSDDQHESDKRTAGLVPFPRTGRSQYAPGGYPRQYLSIMRFPLPSDFTFKDEINPMRLNEVNLDNLISMGKRNSEQGMWFGPRLGRSAKTEDSSGGTSVDEIWAVAGQKPHLLKPASAEEQPVSEEDSHRNANSFDERKKRHTFTQ